MSGTERVVLIVEPYQAIRELYVRALAPSFDVIALSDEDIALQILLVRPIAALVIEPALFAVHDWDRLVAIGRVCAARAVTLIICSTLDERRRASELEVAAYLIKPTLPSVLLSALRHAIEGGR